MKANQRNNQLGVTLVEMLLVLVIASSIIYMSVSYFQQKAENMRIDRTSVQMQQILNASLSYYVANSQWPASLVTLQPTYLPGSGGVMPNPWNGSSYGLTSTTSNVYVYTQLITGAKTPALAQIIMGTLPLSYTATTIPASGAPVSATCTAASNCYVVTTVNIPGQNLNNSSAVNFAGLYHNGACVPQPSCPVDASGNTTTPEVMIVPVSVNGYYNAPTGAPCTPTDLSGCTVNSYPLSGFTAYATGPAAATAGSGPPNCTGSSSATTTCASDSAGDLITDGNNYWRACLAVRTEAGDVTPNTDQWGQLVGVVMAITRCVQHNENPGSGFDVWQ